MPPRLSDPCPPYTKLGLPEWATGFYATRVINGATVLHAAIDLARDEQGRPMPEGALLISPMPDGSVVRQAGWGDSNTGNLVTIYKDGFESRSLHNRDVLVVPGQIVNRGQTLAHCGQTGLANGVHSHWAVWADTKALALQVQPDPVLAYGKWAVNPQLLLTEEDDILAGITREEWNALVSKVDGLSTDVHNKANDILVTMFRGRLPLAMVKTDSNPDVFGIFVHRNDNGVLLIRRHHVGSPLIFHLLNGAFGELRTNLYGAKAPLVETITDAEMNSIKIGNQLDLTL